MRNLRILHCCIILLILTLMIPQFSNAQIKRSNEGAFKFKKDIWTYSDFSGISMKNVKVSVLWNSLMGEPIEDYKFYWEIDKISIGRFMKNPTQYNIYSVQHPTEFLKGHPDLIKRMVDIKPKFNLKFEAFIAVPKDLYYSYQINMTRIVSSNSFVVEPSGSPAKFSVPSSPSWHDFFGINKENSWAEGQLKDMKARFKLKESIIHIHKVTIQDVEWPESIIKSIIHEWERREEKKRQQAEADEELEDIDDIEINQDDIDDEWATDDNLNKSDEWEDYVTVKPLVTTVNGKQGVLDETSGKVLVPFKFDKVVRYENGMATVRIKTDHERISYSNCAPWSLTYYNEGVVDQDGEFLIPPRKVLVSKEVYVPSNLTLVIQEVTPIFTSVAQENAWRREQERKKKAAEKRKEEQRRLSKICRDKRRRDVKAAEAQVRNNGGIVEN